MEITAWCIDDSFVIRTILETVLRRAGIRGIVFPNGYQALHAFQTQQLLAPDIIFLDLVMPGIDGLALLRILRRNELFDQTTIVMLTARDSVLTRIKSQIVGAQHFVGKPFRTEQIQAILREILFQKQSEQLAAWFSSNWAKERSFPPIRLAKWAGESQNSGGKSRSCER